MLLDKFDFEIYFHWLAVLLERIGVDAHLGFNVILISLILIIGSYFLGKNFRRSELVEPSFKASLPSTLILGLDTLYNNIENQIGPLSHKLFWILGGFFIFILSCNFWGLIPGFVPPTEKFSLTFSLGIFSFLVYNILGIKYHGIGYLKHFMGPVLLISPLIFVIEIISHIVRPVTLGLRLFGNITGDHLVVNLFTEKIFPVILPIPFIALGVFISFVQAFVFYQLSIVYIQGSTSEEH